MRVKCPIHNIEMYSHPSTEEYACQNSQCIYASGISKRMIESFMRWADLVRGKTDQPIQEWEIIND